MPPHVRLSLSSAMWQEHFRHRTYGESLGEFLPRSVATRDIRFDPAATWQDVVDLLKGFEWFDLSVGEKTWRISLKRGGDVVEIQFARGRAHIEGLSASNDVQALIDEVLRLLGPRSPKENEERADGVWADFCVLEEYGTRNVSQFVRCPEWEAIRGNYADATRAAVDALLALPDPRKRGQLIVWHGPTGTGKTFALRALMRSWRTQYVPTVLADPEKFAKHPEYYFDLASDPLERSAGFEDIDDVLDGLAHERVERAPARRRLFILEDSASLLFRHGESGSDVLGRLLNMTDGLLGQGREDLFLITFNEEVEQIDPAFLRSGRCVAHVRFPLLPRVVATEWLRSRGQEATDVGDATSLADLFARTEGGPIRDEGVDALAGPKGFGVRKRQVP
ncbi:MAG: AAA family ATPase [Planctomycetota bacterium]